jgi:hypothetical protein
VSSNLAFATPLRSPREETAAPHIEIVSSREQRKARPRVTYAVLTVAGFFAIFIAQLLMSIVVSDGAYRIAGLQTEQRDLTRQEQALSEQLDLLASPQNLATQAEALGMTLSGSSPAFLDLSSGAIVGDAGASTGGGDALIAAQGSLVPNSLLGDIPLVTATTPAAPGTAATVDGTVATAPGTPTVPTAPGVPTTPGAPTVPVAAGSVPSTPVALPSPVVR